MKFNKATFRPLAVLISSLFMSIFLIHCFVAWVQKNDNLHEGDVFIRKLQYYSTHKEEFDAIFIGSSRVYRQVVPLLIDEAVSSTIPNFKSFNFGVPGMNWAEAMYLLNYLKQNPSSKLKYVFIEPITHSSINEDNLLSSRAHRTHDFMHTSLALKHVFESPDIPSKLIMSTRHIQSFLYRITMTGALVRLHHSFFREDLSDRDSMESNRGFWGLEKESLAYRERQVDFLKFPEHYQASLQAALASKGISYKSEQFESQIKSLNALKFKALSLDAQFFLLVPPAIDDPVAPIIDQLSSILNCPVFSYSDIKKNSEMYLLENRWDAAHLNAKGAALLTKKLAQDFINYVRVTKEVQ